MAAAHLRSAVVADRQRSRRDDEVVRAALGAVSRPGVGGGAQVPPRSHLGAARLQLRAVPGRALRHGAPAGARRRPALDGDPGGGAAVRRHSPRRPRAPQRQRLPDGDAVAAGDALPLDQAARGRCAGARRRSVVARDAGLAGGGGDRPVPDPAAGGAPAGHAAGVPGALRLDGAAGRALVAPRRAAGDSPGGRRPVHRRCLAGALGARAHRFGAKGVDDFREVRVARHHPLLRAVDDVECAAPLVSVHLAAGHAEPGDLSGVPLGTRARGASPVAGAPVVPAADEAAAGRRATRSIGRSTCRFAAGWRFTRRCSGWG